MNVIVFDLFLGVEIDRKPYSFNMFILTSLELYSWKIWNSWLTTILLAMRSLCFFLYCLCICLRELTVTLWECEVYFEMLESMSKLLFSSVSVAALTNQIHSRMQLTWALWMEASEKKRKAHENDDQGTYYSAKKRLLFIS